MQAVILAAGESSRFWPLNKEHKSQTKLLGKSLLYWTVKGLNEKGIKDIVFVIRPDSALKQEAATISQELGVSISCVIQEEPLGTGNALFRAKNLIKQSFFVVWPYKVDVKEIIEKVLQDQKSEVIFVGSKTLTPWEYGILKLEGEKVIEICENPKQGEEVSDVRVTGTYFLQPDFFTFYEKLSKHHGEDFVDALNLYIKEKEAKVVLWNDNLVSLKYPWALFQAMRFKLESEEFKSYISPSALIGKNVVINGNVYIGENAVIGDNTVITGPCFINDNCKIGASNVLRGPVNFEKDVVTGAFSEVKDCIIQEGTHLHSGYFGDSIFGKNCRIGAGFATANRKIDRSNIKSIVKGKKIDTCLTSFGTVVGENSRFGVQSGTMPGVLIGSDCLVGPGTLVFENLEDNTTCYAEFKYKIKKK